MKVVIDGVEYVPKVTAELQKMLTCADILEQYIGTHEYNGIVRTMITWYFDGSFSEVAWCAIAVSWALRTLGIKAYSITEKEANCYRLDTAFKRTGTSASISTTNQLIKRGDIIFFKWDKSQAWSENANKHVSVAYEDAPGTFQKIKCIGGNQSDSINITDYSREYIQSIWRPDYSHNTLTG